ncbi:MAG: hypothetical protein V4568_11435 [Pseudomonadota bacterium]
MISELIPEDIRKFIFLRIDSIAHMEALLLLRLDPTECWDSASVASRLYISDKEAATLLMCLHADGFLVETGSRFQYRCCSIELEQMVDRVADAYTRHLILITNLIHSKSLTKIREFADAFKLRKDR